jgi:hypothetical protein
MDFDDLYFIGKLMSGYPEQCLNVACGDREEVVLKLV